LKMQTGQGEGSSFYRGRGELHSVKRKGKKGEGTHKKGEGGKRKVTMCWPRGGKKEKIISRKLKKKKGGRTHAVQGNQERSPPLP